MPILLMADDSELPRLAKGLDLGANDYLVRPVDRNELLARVRTQIRRKRLQDRLHENYSRSLSLALTDERCQDKHWTPFHFGLLLGLRHFDCLPEMGFRHADDARSDAAPPQRR